MSIVTHIEESEIATEFLLERVLVLACAAQRTNMAYVKDAESVFDIAGKFCYMKHTNKTLIQKALGLEHCDKHSEKEFSPTDLFVEAGDKEMAAEIKKYFRRLLFAAVKGSNEFETEVNFLLNCETVPVTKFGFIACLPSVYARNIAQSCLEKRLRDLSDGYVGEVGQTILDKDCEILQCIRSKNFDAWNVDAIIDNRMVSWFSKIQFTCGACVVVKCKIKDHSKHWKHQNLVTRLNYVKAVQ